jgi:hypothetical protein
VNIDGKTYNKGQIVPTNKDLVKAFGTQMFQETNKKGREIDPDEVEADDAPVQLEDARETQAAEKTSKDASEASPAGSDDASDADAVEKVESSLGDDVSDKFPAKVVENDLAVLKKGKHYFVVDRDDPESPLKDGKNEVELNSHKDVVAFVEKFLKG